MIVTGAYGEEAAEAALECSVPHFLRKPYKFDDLRQLIRQPLALCE